MERMYVLLSTVRLQLHTLQCHVSQTIPEVLLWAARQKKESTVVEMLPTF